MEKELSFNKILCYDYQKQVALPLAEKIKEHISNLAAKEGIPIEYMGLSKIRKEDFVNEKIKIVPVKKNIHSIGVLFYIMSSSNRRYMEFISNLNLHVEGRKLLKKTTSPLKEGNRNYKGLNFFNEDDDMLLRIISSGEFNITGFRNKDLQEKLGLTCGQVSRQMKRLRTHGIIKKIGKSYTYYITKNGQKVIMTRLKLKELYIIPKLDFCA